MISKQIQKLIKELYDNKWEKRFTEEDIIRVLNQDNIYPFFYTNPEGQIISMAILYTVELFTRKIGVIEEVVTLKEYRNAGISSGIIRRAIAKAKDLGLTCLELNVREDKVDVQKYYKNIGFYDRKNKAMRMWINKQ